VGYRMPVACHMDCLCHSVAPRAGGQCSSMAGVDWMPVMCVFLHAVAHVTFQCPGQMVRMPADLHGASVWSRCWMGGGGVYLHTHI
jgi:hypothetical protein